MKTRGKIRYFKDIDGRMTASWWPQTQGEALQEGVSKYWPQEKCPIHGGNPVVYTRTQIRGCCAQLNAVDEYNAALRRGEPIYINEARDRGFDFIWHPQENKHCGHPGKLTLSGKCYFCEEVAAIPSPRQMALRAGETWYTPLVGDECNTCKTLARRRVANGSCEKCEEDWRMKSKGDPPLYELYPDMVLDKKSAITLGFKHYHGNPCREGHNGWRYISTNGCVHCRKGVK